MNEISPNTAGPDASERFVGVGYGLFGVLLTSVTLPATALALLGFHPMMAAFGRTVLVFPLALGYLLWVGSLLPPRSAYFDIAILISGNVLGFPVFAALAVQHGSAANSAVILGLMPITMALISVFTGTERVGWSFWLWAVLGAASIVAFSVLRGGFGTPSPGDVFSLLSVVTGSFGLVSGSILTRTHGPMRTISWGVVCGFPIALTAVVVHLTIGHTMSDIPVVAWVGMVYVSLASSFLAFIPWNIGLARGGASKVGQLQLAQPILTLFLSVLILGEELTAWMVVVSLMVMVCVVCAGRSRLRIVWTARTSSRRAERHHARVPSPQTAPGPPSTGGR
ncbi:DMT family transporter [Nocardiopsis sp. NPDC007018]|uniref:DMT family transporter n=1 Tax=Nocardiopsis sp. NPDC007018 TaxID=3155721 RepID=UPI0033CBEDF1